LKKQIKTPLHIRREKTSNTTPMSHDLSAPTTIEDWILRPPSFVFADPEHTMLIWDTEEGGGVITKHTIGKLPPRHAEGVILMLMRTLDEIGKERRSKQKHG
jgi:hypothetical protein